MALLEETRLYHEEAKRLIGDRWRGDGLIVSAWDGTPLNKDTPSKQWRKFADKHGFEGIRFHDLRHSHASILFANNLDAVAVATRMGHASADTTLRIYAHALRRRDRESAAAMQALLDRAAGSDAPAADQQRPAPDLAALDPATQQLAAQLAAQLVAQLAGMQLQQQSSPADPSPAQGSPRGSAPSDPNSTP